MPKIENELVVDAPVDHVWKTVIDIERFPAMMPSVRSVRVIEQQNVSHRTSAWSVTLKGSILEWVEDEMIDPEAMSTSFSQTSGDLEHLEGSWRLEDLGDGTTLVRLCVSFEIGIPLLAETLNPVAERSFQENCREMVLGVERAVSVA